MTWGIADRRSRTLGDGRYRATLSQEWEIWGPMGGYVAAVALRAAGAATSQPNPAAFSCHYLGVARFEPVDIEVTAVKEGRAASSHRVSITQDGKPILEALVWSTADNEGLEHDETTPPDVPGSRRAAEHPGARARRRPAAVPVLAELRRQADPLRAAVAARRARGRPTWQEWLRFLPDRHVRRPVGRRRSLGDPRRPAELAVGPPPPRLAAAAVHGADARPERRVPPAHAPASRGSSATAPRRCRPAASSAGRPGSGRRAASSTRPAAASASTAEMPQPA